MMKTIWDILNLKCSKDLRGRVSHSFIPFHFTNIYKCQGCSSRSDRQDPCSDGVRHGKTDSGKQGLRRAGALGCRRDWGLSACLGTEAEEPEGRVICQHSEAAREGASTKKTTQEQRGGGWKPIAERGFQRSVS